MSAVPCLWPPLLLCGGRVRAAPLLICSRLYVLLRVDRIRMHFAHDAWIWMTAVGHMAGVTHGTHVWFTRSVART